MITIGQRIQALMTRRKIRSANALFKLLKKEFGAAALSQTGLSHLMRKDTKPREYHILQLISILDVSRKEFIQGTTLEEKLKVKTLVLWADNQKGTHAASYQLLGDQPPASLIKLKLKTLSRTRDEQDDGDLPDAKKYIAVASGSLTIVIVRISGEEKIKLNKGDGYILNSKQLHYFENDSTITTTAFITHFPNIASPFHYTPK